MVEVLGEARTHPEIRNSYSEVSDVMVGSQSVLACAYLTMLCLWAVGFASLTGFNVLSLVLTGRLAQQTLLTGYWIAVLGACGFLLAGLSVSMPTHGIWALVTGLAGATVLGSLRILEPDWWGAGEVVRVYGALAALPASVILTFVALMTLRRPSGLTASTNDFWSPLVWALGSLAIGASIYVLVDRDTWPQTLVQAAVMWFGCVLPGLWLALAFFRGIRRLQIG
jgi:hypothetical protein